MYIIDFNVYSGEEPLSIKYRKGINVVSSSYILIPILNTSIVNIVSIKLLEFRMSFYIIKVLLILMLNPFFFFYYTYLKKYPFKYE